MSSIEIIYSPLAPAPLFRETISLVPGMTVRAALSASTLYSQYPEAQTATMGIFSQAVTLDALLKEGDRLELYRPLQRDPKDKRRLLAKQQKKNQSV